MRDSPDGSMSVTSAISHYSDSSRQFESATRTSFSDLLLLWRSGRTERWAINALDGDGALLRGCPRFAVWIVGDAYLLERA